MINCCYSFTLGGKWKADHSTAYRHPAIRYGEEGVFCLTAL